MESCTMILCLDEPLAPRFNLTTPTSHKASLTKRQSSFTAGEQPQEKTMVLIFNFFLKNYYY